ncbi:MAG: glycosyltransferase [Candidatus Diapherotrites archaeon]|uniref:Glycosyltransferase n=1 Tax=Candidatus Iainarchaeum sp. TaxID=3101447 RepID=A0A938YUU9_9ARCH|nr:glycosyltransferase [Candidatus Diapherotrites archaeon]
MSKVFEQEELPAIDLGYFNRMTDGTGMLQHSTHSVPCFKTGYTTDDNARALVAVLWLKGFFPKAQIEELAIRYLAFIHYCQKEDGTFHNHVSFDRRFLDEQGSWDCFGRVLWACGFALSSSLNENIKAVAKKIIDEAMPHIALLNDPRPIAFALMGVHFYSKARPEQQDLVEKASRLGMKLVSLLEENSSPGWAWFEDILTYCNARMPQALFLAFESTGEKRFLEAAEKSYAFLKGKTFDSGMFVPVGQDGWLPSQGEKALFDQQPIEAGCMAEAALAAFNSTGKRIYAEDALVSFQWFLGKNTLKEPLFDSTMSACFDGLTKEAPNFNQGAESTIAFLMARLAVEELIRKEESELAVD